MKDQPLSPIPKPTKIYYASVPPGAGKTQWAIEQIAKNLRSENPETTFYVAPTITLLKEVLKKIPEDVRSKVHRITSSKNGTSTVLNRLRLCIDGGKGPTGESKKAYPKGRVYFITHQTFLGLPMNFPQRSEIKVIFDEARKCTMDVQSFSFTTEQLTGLLRLLGNPTSIAGERYVHLQVPSRFNTQELDRLLSSSSETRQARPRLLRILEAARSDAVELLLNVSRIEADDTTAHLTLQAVLTPSRILFGWAKVAILSAYFEDSQMYHLLKRYERPVKEPEESQAAFNRRVAAWTPLSANAIELIDASSSVINKKRLKALEDRYAMATIVPLMEQPLSLTLIQNGIVGAPNEKEKIKKLYAKFAALTPDRTVRIQDYIKIKEASKDHDLPCSDIERRAIEMMEHYESKGLMLFSDTPLGHMASMAIFLSMVWQKDRNTREAPLPIVVNVGKDRSIYESQLSDSMPTKSYVNLPIISQGLNHFIKYDTIAFLAAINPTPAVVHLLSELIPGYDAHRDYSVDQCVQSITRCSIRDTSSKTEPLIIVAGQLMAEQVRDRLGGKPRIVSPEYVVQGFNNYSYFMEYDEDDKPLSRKQSDAAIENDEYSNVRNIFGYGHGPTHGWGEDFTDPGEWSYLPRFFDFSIYADIKTRKRSKKRAALASKIYLNKPEVKARRIAESKFMMQWPPFRKMRAMEKAVIRATGTEKEHLRNQLQRHREKISAERAVRRKQFMLKWNRGELRDQQD